MPLNYSNGIKINGTFDVSSRILINYCDVSLDNNCIDLNNQTNKD